MAMMNAGYSVAPETDRKKAEREAARQKNWQQMLQMAAVANKMNDRTALGFGLGMLLANNWDKWFGGKGKKSGNNGTGSTDSQYSFAQNMATAQDPLQFAAAGGDPHAKWALENNQPFSLAAAVQNPNAITARPMPDNLTVNGTGQQMIANAQPAYNPMPMPTLTVDGNGVQGMNSGAFNTMNPANFDNWAKANGGFSLGQMPNTPNVTPLGDYGEFTEGSDLWKKLFGGEK
jgi:hypothetical protein